MVLGHCVVAEAKCNWYLRDINIYSLSKNVCKKKNYKISSGERSQYNVHYDHFHVLKPHADTVILSMNVLVKIRRIMNYEKFDCMLSRVRCMHGSVDQFSNEEDESNCRDVGRINGSVILLAQITDYSQEKA
jgi:hypothetical protein